jgi:hypothetical protein
MVDAGGGSAPPAAGRLPAAAGRERGGCQQDS